MSKTTSAKKPHRYLFDKIKLLRDATAALVLEPSSIVKAAYLTGLCDSQHGAAGLSNEELAKAIHTARQVIIACKE